MEQGKQVIRKVRSIYSIMFSCLVLVIGSAEVSSAGILTYTFTTTGTHSGSLGSGSFSNATISFSGSINSTQVNSGSVNFFDGTTFLLKSSPVLTTVDVTIDDPNNGLITTSLVADTGNNWAVFVADYQNYLGIGDGIGFGQFTTAGEISIGSVNIGGVVPTGDSQDIYGSFAVAASYSLDYSKVSRTFSTTSGSLEFTGDATQSGSMNSSGGSGGGTVPEPSTAFAMSLLSLIGFAGNRCRRRTALNA